MRSNRARFHAPAPVIIGVVALLLATIPVSAQDVWTPSRWAPLHVACPPDGRTVDVPDGMAWGPLACEIFDPLVQDALRFALEHDLTPDAALTLFHAFQWTRTRALIPLGRGRSRPVRASLAVLALHA